MTDLPVGQKTPLIEAPKADARSVFRRFNVPLCGSSRTWRQDIVAIETAIRVDMILNRHECLLDHAICAAEQSGRHVEAERLGRRQVDDEYEHASFGPLFSQEPTGS